MRLVKRLEAVTAILDRPLEIIAIAALGISLLLAFVEVVTRYAFGVTHAWAGDVSIYLSLYAVFLFAGVALKRGAHLVIDAFSSHLTGKMRATHAVMMSLLSSVMCGYFFWYGVKLVQLNYQGNMYTPNQIIPAYIPLIAFPAGMLLFTFYSLVQLARSISSFHGEKE